MGDEDDLLVSSDSDDTDDLLESAKSKPIAKKRLQKKSSSTKKQYPDADNDDDDDNTAGMTKRERMEALSKKRHGGEKETKNDRNPKRNDAGQKSSGRDKGYDSGDSYDSATFVRTKEDDDFIDREGDDEDAYKELHKEQHFDDDRPDGEDDEMEERSRRKTSSSSRKTSSSADKYTIRKDSDNPLDQAIERMKRKKKSESNFGEMEAKELIARMNEAAEEDEKAMKEKRLGTKKLKMMGEVVELMGKRDIIEVVDGFNLLSDLLSACRLWIQPLSSGTLGNLTIRKRMVEAISNLELDKSHLKESRIGQTIMVLYRHKSETPAMKRELKKIIEKWSRPIFQKDMNMKNLESAHRKRSLDVEGLSYISASRRSERAAMAPVEKKQKRDLQSIISSGRTGAQKGLNRVRVPQRKAFHFVHRPEERKFEVKKEDSGETNKSHLAKRMVEKRRARSKNQRSANVSVEGRAVR